MKEGEGKEEGLVKVTVTDAELVPVERIKVSEGIIVEISDDRKEAFRNKYGIELEDFAELYKAMGYLFGALLGVRK